MLGMTKGETWFTIVFIVLCAVIAVGVTVSAIRDVRVAKWTGVSPYPKEEGADDVAEPR